MVSLMDECAKPLLWLFEALFLKGIIALCKLAWRAVVGIVTGIGNLFMGILDGIVGLFSGNRRRESRSERRNRSRHFNPKKVPKSVKEQLGPTAYAAYPGVYRNDEGDQALSPEMFGRYCRAFGIQYLEDFTNNELGNIWRDYAERHGVYGHKPGSKPEGKTADWREELDGYRQLMAPELREREDIARRNAKKPSEYVGILHALGIKVEFNEHGELEYREIPGGSPNAIGLGSD